MGLTLITGSSKTGKTNYITELIKESQYPCVMLVPEQISLMTENKLIEKCGYLSSDRDVLSFGRLFYRVNKEFSYSNRDYITPSGKAVIMTSLINQNSENLSVFSNSKRAEIYSDEILKAISEFKRYGISPEQTAKLSTEFSSQSSKLKFKDLSLLYRLFNEVIEKHGEDAEDNLSRLIKLIPQSEFIKDTVFFIDGFSTFTTTELKIIFLLCRYSRCVYITLKTDGYNRYVFSPVEETKSILKKGVQGIPVKEIHLNENKVHKGELLHLWENFGKFSAPKYKKKCKDIFIYTSDTPENEVRLCARDILKYVRQGYRFSDISVVSGDPEIYSDLAERVFREHGINIYMDRKYNITENSLFLLFTSLFNIFINNFKREDIFSFLKTGYTDISFKSIFLLENYVIKYGISGKKWLEEFTFPDPDLDVINKARNDFINMVLPFRNATKGKSKVSEYYIALKAFIIDNNLFSKAEKVSEELFERGEKDAALELKQVFNSIINVFKEIVTVTEDYSIGIEKFKMLFISGVSKCTVGIIPPTQNSVVFSTYDGARNKDVKILYILNANDGVFPARIVSSGIITEQERSDMKKFNCKIAPDAKQKAFEQPFKVYETLTLPSEKLIISRAVSDSDGQNTVPSEVIKTVKSLFDNISENKFKSKDGKTYVSTPDATLKEMLINRDADFSQVIGWYEKKKNSEKYKEILREKEFTVTAHINQSVNRLLWSENLSVTVSRLEAFARCPYMFLMKYGLKFEKRSENILKSTDTGTFIHKILEDTLTKIIEENRPFSELNPEECVKIADSVSDNAVEELTFYHPNLSGKELFMLKKMKKAACDASIAAIHQIRAGDFIPYGTEMEIGSQSEIPPLSITTPKGNTVKLYGKIDRVDAASDGFRIIDYKSSNHSLEISKVINGVSLQLITYAKAIKNRLGKPYGMYYFVFNPPVIERSSKPEFTDIYDDCIKSYKLSGLTVGDENSVYKADKDIEGYSSIISARSTAGGITSDSLISEKEFEYISEEALKKMGNYSDKILQGNFDIRPLCIENRLACEFCNFKSLCCFENGKFDVRNLMTVSNKNMLAKMRGENQ